ncbi:MAG: molecular chaperone TorD family protein [Rhodospirillales bacterium]|nr:molecular chaperone TorD family protein [Rhodospirillales bacterium]
MADETIAEFRQAVAQDLAALARLHERELDQATLVELHRVNFPDALALRLDEDEVGLAALEGMRLAMAETPPTLADGALDALAADYAAIFLTNAYGAPASESPWLDADGLARQEPTFQVMEAYGRQGYAIDDPLKRPADFLAFELGFLAHLLGGPQDDATALAAASDFLKAHPRLWVGRFAERIAMQADTPFYAGLAALLDAYLETLDDALALIQAGLEPPQG